MGQEGNFAAAACELRHEVEVLVFQQHLAGESNCVIRARNSTSGQEGCGHLPDAALAEVDAPTVLVEMKWEVVRERVNGWELCWAASRIGERLARRQDAAFNCDDSSPAEPSSSTRRRQFDRLGWRLQNVVVDHENPVWNPRAVNCGMLG